MGEWYTVGLALGLGLGLGVIVAGLFAVNRAGLAVSLAAGAAVGFLIGLGIGKVGPGQGAEEIAGAVGGFLGALSAAAVVFGARRRGATRLGLGAFVGMAGLLVALVSLVPIVGYVVTIALPLLAARMRGRQAARFAGLRTLAK
jgi:hypothetical protein